VKHPKRSAERKNESESEREREREREREVHKGRTRTVKKLSLFLCPFARFLIVTEKMSFQLR